MEPSKNALEWWWLSMKAFQTLGKGGLEDLNELLSGIVIAAFENPLLRIITINDRRCIAHVTPGGIAMSLMGNPLENTSSKGALRAIVSKGSGVIMIEQNKGPRYKDDIARELERSCSDAGREMSRTGDFLGPQGQKFANLLPLTMDDYGSAFAWAPVVACPLCTYRKLEVIDRENDPWYGKSTFDIILSL